MKNVVKGLLLGGIISIGTIIGSEGVRQILRRRRDQEGVRLAPQGSIPSLIPSVQGGDVHREVQHSMMETETDVVMQNDGTLHENIESQASSFPAPLQKLQKTRHGDALKKNSMIPPVLQAKFAAEGIVTVSQLLERTKTQSDRVALALNVGTTAHHLKELVMQADLMRLNGVNAEVVLLLKTAGITSCDALHQRNAQHLHATLDELHTHQNSVKSLPTLKQVTAWIAEANEFALPPASSVSQE